MPFQRMASVWVAAQSRLALSASAKPDLQKGVLWNSPPVKRVQGYFDKWLRNRPHAIDGIPPAVCNEHDVISSAPLSLHLAMSTGTAEWLNAVSSKPDDVQVVLIHLERVILQPAHPLGELLVGLATLLSELVGRRGTTLSCTRHLRDVAAALNVGSERLQRIMLELMPPLGMTKQHVSIVNEVIRTKLFSIVGPTFLESVREATVAEDQQWGACIATLTSMKPVALDVPRQFHLPGEQLPYAPVIQHLQAVLCFPAPHHKLERFYDAAVAIAPCISRYHQRAGNASACSRQVVGKTGRTPSHQNLCDYMVQDEALSTQQSGARTARTKLEEARLRRSMDYPDEGPYTEEDLAVGTEELLPLMAYALVRAQLPAVVSELRFIELFLGDDPHLLNGPLGFCLATFKGAVELVLSMDDTDARMPPAAVGVTPCAPIANLEPVEERSVRGWTGPWLHAM